MSAALLRDARALLDGLYPPESCHGLDLSAYERPEVTLFVARDPTASRSAAAPFSCTGTAAPR